MMTGTTGPEVTKIYSGATGVLPSAGQATFRLARFDIVSVRLGACTMYAARRAPPALRFQITGPGRVE